jgi:hypothetical protein
MTILPVAARRLARECRNDAHWLRGFSIAAAIATGSAAFASMPKWAILFAVSAIFMEFIAATLRHDSKKLDQFADQEEQP